MVKTILNRRTMPQLPSNADVLKARQQYQNTIQENRNRLQDLEIERAACQARITLAQDVLDTFKALYGND